ncbi:MAG TPA: hypothetical protein H9746_00900 [Candidatus Butyricicoccus avistercoris]|uniref:Phage protein n=1 Tax=Candidatus Butyricicoccus avistercoris TaxID=2838518 RepID=A0A9D1PFZ3_9FIRM|nr:hypothetical protein [Candidatus Butyricicoccus avistercoris]
MMLSEIIDGIAVVINSIFGDEIEIYKDNVTQGLKEPCFFVAILKPEVTPLIGTRSVRNNSFDIQYFPKESNTEMLDVAEKLINTLEFITLLNGDILHGTGVSYEIIDNVLHFFISYNLTMIKVTDKTNMETLETDISVKKG